MFQAENAGSREQIVRFLVEIAGQVMDDRHEGNYEIITATSKEDSEIDVRQAHHFVDEVKTWLRREKWL